MKILESNKKIMINNYKGLEPFVIKNYQKEYIENLSNSKTDIHLVSKQRQVGGSLITLLYCLDKLLENSCKILFISSNTGTSRHACHKLGEIYNNNLYFAKDHNLLFTRTQNSIKFDNNSKMVFRSAKSDLLLNHDINSYDIIIFDEAAFIENLEAIVSSIKEDNKKSQLVFISSRDINEDDPAPLKFRIHELKKTYFTKLLEGNEKIFRNRTVKFTRIERE